MPSTIEYALLAAHVYEVNYRITDDVAEKINEGPAGGDLTNQNYNEDTVSGWEYVGYSTLAPGGVPLTDQWDDPNTIRDHDGFFANVFPTRAS